MNTASNILRILIIVLIGVVVVAVLLMAAMVLIPAFSLFGVKFVSYAGSGSEPDQKIDIEVDSTEWKNAEALVIETNGWGVEFRPFSNVGDTLYHVDGKSSVRVLFYSQYTGFVKVGEEGEKKAECNEEVYGKHQASGGLNACIISTKEPDALWITKSKAKMIVIYDKDALGDRQVFITTNNGSVYLGSNSMEEKNRDVINNDVNIISKSGKITVGNIDVTKSLNITKDGGDLDIKTNMSGNMVLSLNSGYGSINMKEVGTDGSQSGSASVNFKNIRNANIQFDAIYGDLQYMTGNSGLIRGKKVTGSLIVNETKSCVFKVGSIGKDVTFNSDTGSLFASYVGGKVNKSTISGNGQICIKALEGTCEIESKNGRVALGENFKDSEATAFAGVKGNATVTTTGGDVYIKCAGRVELNVKSEKGFVQLDDVMGKVTYSVVDNGKSRVKATYKELVGFNSYTTGSGSVEIYIPTSVPANLTWNSQKETDIEVSGLRTKEKTGTSKPINGASSSSGTLGISTVAGKITIKDAPSK